MRFRALLLVFCLIALGGSAAFAATVRDQEIMECRSGEIATWSDGKDRRAVSSSLHIAYSHNGAPSWFSQAEVESMVARAAQAWTQCGIPALVVARREIDLRRPGAVLVQWSEAGSLGNFGLANYSKQTLSLGPDAFSMLHSRNPAYDATQTLQMVISHEMGHFFGLMAHSRRCIDVLSYYHDLHGGKCFSRDPTGVNSAIEYRHILPTACDIERCRAANGLPPLPGGRLQ